MQASNFGQAGAHRPPRRPPAPRPSRQSQLEWIAALPASRAAERLLDLPGVGGSCRDPGLPALLALLQWALEEFPGPDKSRARAAWEDLMQLDLRGDPAAAVMVLLSCADPESEVPAQLLAGSAAQAAAGIVALAAACDVGHRRAGGRAGPDLFTRAAGTPVRTGIPAALAGDSRRCAKIAENQ